MLFFRVLYYIISTHLNSQSYSYIIYNKYHFIMFSIIWIFVRVIAYLAAVPSKHLQYILILQDIRSNVGWVFIELLLVVFLYVGIVPSESMYPTLHIGDASIVVRLHCLVGLKRNNIVIFKLGGDISDNTQEILVKRIVALSVSFCLYGFAVCFF